MTVLSRKILKSFFSKGRRPSEDHFKSLIDSFVHKQEDDLPDGGEPKAPRGFVAVMPAKENADVQQRTAESHTVAAGAGGMEWLSFTVKAADFKDASTSKSVAVGDLPAKSLILGVFIKHHEAFTGKEVSGYTLSVGSKSSKEMYAEAYDVYQKPTATKAGEKQLFLMTNWARKTKFYVTASSEGGNLDKVTEGEAEILILTTSPA
ncbi:MAG: hypothetical protein WBB45_15870 [Cyclobacteriaceae bacterium]